MSTKHWDQPHRPRPWLITVIASYLALVAFFGLLAGIATWRWDLLRIFRTDVARSITEDDERYPRDAVEVGGRFWPGFAVGCSMGALFIVGYHLQHGRHHLASR